MHATLQKDCDRLRAERRINRLENIAVRAAEVTEALAGERPGYVTVHFLASLLDYTTDEGGTQVLEGPDRAGQVRGVLDLRTPRGHEILGA
jgi:Tim44-like domain